MLLPLKKALAQYTLELALLVLATHCLPLALTHRALAPILDATATATATLRRRLLHPQRLRPVLPLARQRLAARPDGGAGALPPLEGDELVGAEAQVGDQAAGVARDEDEPPRGACIFLGRRAPSCARGRRPRRCRASRPCRLS
jgi:hypothetical protein